MAINKLQEHPDNSYHEQKLKIAVNLVTKLKMYLLLVPAELKSDRVTPYVLLIQLTQSVSSDDVVYLYVQGTVTEYKYLRHDISLMELTHIGLLSEVTDVHLTQVNSTTVQLL